MGHILETWLARPLLLSTLAALPVLLVLFAWAWWRRRRALALLGARRYVLARHGVRRWRGLCLLAAMLLLAVAGAGPQWGRAFGEARAAGHDLVVVLDLSRSMHAEQPSRRERALRLLGNLADTFQEGGGRRLALVVFAAEPRLQFPLTQDYDHFRHSLQQIANDDLPPLLPAPDAPFQSGTRFGAALRLAVEAHDPARAGKQAILLLSDGDDPAADDGEWLQGVLLARERGVPIHTVGVGDPDKPRTIPDGGDVLRNRDKVVTTQLQEALLQEFSRRTGGTYIPAQTHTLPLGTLVQNLLQQQSSEVPASDESLPVFQQRYAWFLGPALALLLLSLLLNEGPADKPVKNAAASRWRWEGALAVGALALVSAQAMPEATPLVQAGNAAFAAGDFKLALKHYEDAEAAATDPGLVAFNKAATLYRLGRFAEAALAYRQCLDDDQVPAKRRGEAQYDLGTALVKQSGGISAALLRRAVSAFRACLSEAELDAELQADARHNLELAQLLYLKARAANPNEPENGGNDQPPEKPPKKSIGPDKDKNGDDAKGGKGDPSQMKDKGNGGKGALGYGGTDKAKAGALQVLPDLDQVVPLPPQEADAHLDAIVDRIVQERRAHWQKTGQAPKDARNW